MASKKFIPNGDRDFAEMARRFADALQRDPRKFEVDPDEAEAVGAAVEVFRGALRAARGHDFRGRSASPVLTLRKEEARQQAEKLVRRVAGAVRGNERISGSDQALLGLRPRKKAGEAAKEAERAARTSGGVLVESPALVFVRALHRAAHVPEHELTFSGSHGKPRPSGAVRLELFVELVSPEDAPQAWSIQRPGQGGMGVHYLRSFVKSPVVLRPPLADRPMRVVYWGRWADAQGNVGPMSKAAAGWVEGGSHHLMAMESPGGERRPKQVAVERLAREAGRLPRVSREVDSRAAAECVAVMITAAPRGSLSVEDGRAAA